MVTVGHLFEGEEDIFEDCPLLTINNMEEYSGDAVKMSMKYVDGFKEKFGDKLNDRNFTFMSGHQDDVFFGIAISAVLAK